MSKRLQITLDEAATRKYLDWVAARVEAEINANCEPSSTRITVEAL